MAKKEEERLAKLAEEAEVILENDYEKKDLKEHRSILKQMLYDGSKRLKHKIPKGVRS